MSIHEKLIAFHTAFKGAPRDGVNPHFKSTFITLDAAIKSTTPALNKAGLYVTHRVEENALVTTVCDESGDGVSSTFPLPSTPNPQAMASAMTYAKRLNLCALLNIAEADDDDGQQAMLEAAANPPPAQITDATFAELSDYIESIGDQMSPQQSGYFSKHPVEEMTEDEAQKILKRLKQRYG